MDLIEIQRAVSSGDYKSLWSDVIKLLPKCNGDDESSCGRVATLRRQEFPQDPPDFRCHAHETDKCERLPWADHVVAAKLMGAIPV